MIVKSNHLFRTSTGRSEKRSDVTHSLPPGTLVSHDLYKEEVESRSAYDSSEGVCSASMERRTQNGLHLNSPQ